MNRKQKAEDRAVLLLGTPDTWIFSAKPRHFISVPFNLLRRGGGIVDFSLPPSLLSFVLDQNPNVLHIVRCPIFFNAVYNIDIFMH